MKRHYITAALMGTVAVAALAIATTTPAFDPNTNTAGVTFNPNATSAAQLYADLDGWQVRAAIKMEAPFVAGFTMATDTTQGPAQNTGQPGKKKVQVTDAGWAAVLNASADFKAMKAPATRMVDQLKAVASIDQAKHPAIAYAYMRFHSLGVGTG